MQLSFNTTAQALKQYDHLVIVSYAGNLKATLQRCNLDDRAYKLCQNLRKKLPSEIKHEAWVRSFYDLKDDNRTVKISLVVLSETASRNMPPANYYQLADAIPKLGIVEDESTAVLISVLNHAHIIGFGITLAKAYPLFDAKTKSGKGKRSGGKNDEKKGISCAFLSDNLINQPDLAHIASVADSVRLSAKIVDMPANIFNTREYADLLKQEAKALGVEFEMIGYKDLVRRGFGGIAAVGRASAKENPPAICVLRYKPQQRAHAHIALVGKGITFDTGGLTLKPRDGMAMMKTDMAGSAAVLGAFRAAVLTKCPNEITAILCIAENAIGAKAYRVDDIIEMYSGKRVEINNTDAEGRLAISDGVAYASKDLKPDLIIDIATLTGAQLFVCGTDHGGVLTENKTIENLMLEVGKLVGEPLFPLIYAPEILMPLFKSNVADFRNSVNVRLCPQSSAAGHFVEQSLDKNYKGEWVHLDIAGPARDRTGGRATAFGAALLYTFISMYHQTH